MRLPPPRVLLALAFALTPAGAQQPDSLIVHTPVRRVARSAGDVASLPHDTATASFHEGPAHLYYGVPVQTLLLGGDPRQSRWIRQVIAIRVRAEE